MSGGWSAILRSRNRSRQFVPTLSGVLLTRLLPPRLPPGCLPREELVSRTAAALSHRLVTVLAGAGYGKSTLLAQALGRTSMPWVWCSCDERLSDRLLLAHVVAGLGERFPGFGAALDFDEDPRAAVTALCNEIVATIPESFLLVFDDVHALPTSASEALAVLVGDLPPDVHVALAARPPLTFPLGRLRVGGLVEFGPGDLALTREEGRDLLRAAGGAVPDRLLEEVYLRTEGWMTGLLLAARTGNLDAPPDARSTGQLFAYLAEEVLAGQPFEVQEFLLRTAVLERFTPELAAAVSGRPDAVRLCRELVARQLFTIRLDDQGEWYRYHHLFHAFLRERLPEFGEDLRQLHRRAGDAWVRADEALEAVRHYLRAGEPERAAATLESVAEGLIHSAEAETLGRLVGELPPELLAARPGLVLANASLHFTRGEHEASFAGIEQAIDRLLAVGEQERACIAFFRLLLSMIAAGAGPPRRFAAIDRFVPHLDPDARSYPAASLMVALSYGFGCEFDRAEEALRQTMARQGGAHSVLDDYARLIRAFYIEYPQGRWAEALRGLDRAIVDLERRGAEDRLAFGVYGRVGRGFILLEAGHHEEALLELARMQDMAERRGMREPPSRMSAWQHAMGLAGLGRWDELERELAPPPTAEAPGEVTHYAYRLRVPAALLAAHRRDVESLRQLVAESRAAMADHGLSFEHAWLLCELALASLRCELADVGAQLAEEAHAIAAARGQAWARARAALLLAVARGPGEEGDRRLTEALELTERHGYDELWSVREPEWAGQLLARAFERSLGPEGLAVRLLARSGPAVLAECAERLREAAPPVRALLAGVLGEADGVDAELLEHLLRDRHSVVRKAAQRSRARVETRPRPPLRLIALGGFAVRRGQLEVPPSAFGRQRARALLAGLLCAGRPVHREELLEWFWPDLPPDRGARALHVTLHGLRRALEPELGRPAESSVVLTEGDSYRVALSPGDSWDVADFLRHAQAGVNGGHTLEQLTTLEAARAAYTGPLFPEWPYEEWSQARRAEVEHARRKVLETLAAGLMEAGRGSVAVVVFQELLELEPEREAWHRGLMRAYSRTGEQALALRQFHACRTVMRQELGVEPSRETRALYQRILNEEPVDELNG